MFNYINIALAPNLLFKDVVIALSYVFLPWKWWFVRSGRVNQQLEKKLETYLNVLMVRTFDSGRSALLAILQMFELQLNDEVLISGYTCVVVSNAVLWAGGIPKYVDIESDTFNLNPVEVEKNITPQTKILIIQHTFGASADLKSLLQIAKKYKLLVIEDCAHALGSEYQGKKVGSFGDASIFSFGRDKIISGVHGGALAINNSKYIKKINIYHKQLPFPNICRVWQHLWHAIILFLFVKPFYNFFNLGKVILVLSQKLKLISKVFVLGEKKGVLPKLMPARFPNSLAEIALNQFIYLNIFNQHRIDIAEYYTSHLKGLPIKLPVIKKNQKHIYIRYTIQTDQAQALFNFAKNQNIILGKWYNTPVAPMGIVSTVSKYKIGLCPVADKISHNTVNLPTSIHISKKDAEKVVQVIREFFT